MPDFVDVILLDIDGVLLPFGGTRNNYHKDNFSFAEGCIFPDSAMDALTALLQRISNISFDISAETNDNDASSNAAIRGTPVLVLSSTWRARPEFIQDILSSFRAFVFSKKGSNDTAVLEIWEKHSDAFFDITNPQFHATRHDEIYKWINDNKQQRASSQYPHSKVAKPKFIIRSWIALDDEDLVNVEGRISTDAMEHAVQTKSSVGLENADVDVGVQLVKQQMQDFHGVSS